MGETGVVEDARRRAAIDAYGILDEPPARDLQALVDIAAQVCGVSWAAINIITEDSQHQIAATGMDLSVCTRSDSMCAAVLAEPSAVLVADARVDPLFRDNAFVTGDLGRVRFYASAPLVTPRGVIIGRLCVFDPEARHIEARQAEVLEQLARRVVDLLELRLRTQQLEEAFVELSGARDELARSNELLDRFTAQVSHDLLNPLTAVIMSTEMLADDPVIAGHAGLSRMARNAASAARRLLDMVEDVRRFARLGATLSLDETDVDALARAALEDLDTLRRASGARVDLGHLGSVRADGSQLYAVLQNLLSNAMKFRRPGVAPTVSVRREDRPGAVRLLVADDGPGIPPGQREEAFRLFARGPAAAGVDGDGIGLATVRRVIESHGGSVHLEERPGGGTLAVVELPNPA